MAFLWKYHSGFSEQCGRLFAWAQPDDIKGCFSCRSHQDWHGSNQVTRDLLLLKSILAVLYLWALWKPHHLQAYVLTLRCRTFLFDWKWGFILLSARFISLDFLVKQASYFKEVACRLNHPKVKKSSTICTCKTESDLIYSTLLPLFCQCF